MKARASSDPSTHQENDTFESCQKFSVTLPNRIAPHLRKAEPFPSISAAQLLSLEVSHSGWVRKEGFGIRTCMLYFFVFLVNVLHCVGNKFRFIVTSICKHIYI